MPRNKITNIPEGTEVKITSGPFKGAAGIVVQHYEGSESYLYEVRIGPGMTLPFKHSTLRVIQ